MFDIVGSTRCIWNFELGAAARRPLPLLRPCDTLNCPCPALPVSCNIHPQYYSVPSFSPLASRQMPGHVILSISSVAEATNRSRSQGRITPWWEGSHVNRTNTICPKHTTENTKTPLLHRTSETGAFCIRNVLHEVYVNIERPFYLKIFHVLRHRSKQKVNFAKPEDDNNLQPGGDVLPTNLTHSYDVTSF